MDDEQIVAGLQAGGPRRGVFEMELYKHFFYFIRQGVQKHKLPEDEVASVYSDTIIVLIENIVTVKFRGRSSLKSYATQIFSNKCVDLLRKITTNKSRVYYKTADISSLVAMLPDKTGNALQQLSEKYQRCQILEKLNEIGEKCKSILLRFVDGYNDNEIAEMMAYNSPDVARTTRLRCVEKLKQIVTGSK